jgi:protein TonB
MFGSKIDLFRGEWLDVIFDQKNKHYGAYVLRKQNAANTTKSLFYASTVFIAVFLAQRSST